ncbi:MAG: ribose 5-phosphate isomerase B [Clostridiales bacterium]|nr:ribose 5-phosphate isomerase B [Clostridiales bacterium]
MMKKIAIACDHGGYPLKLAVMQYLEKEGYTCQDFGCDGPESVDYPDYGVPACEAVAAGTCDRAILICGTGIGMSMCANKVRGIRAACCSDTFSVRMTRLHNDANVLCFGARVVGEGLALDLVELFLKTEFMGGYHCGRIEKVMKIENR